MQDLSSPSRDWALKWKLRVLITGPPRKSPFCNRYVLKISYMPGPVLDIWNISMGKIWSLSSILSEYFSVCMTTWPHPEDFQPDLPPKAEHMLAWSKVAWRTPRCSSHLGHLQSRSGRKYSPLTMCIPGFWSSLWPTPANFEQFTGLSWIR